MKLFVAVLLCSLAYVSARTIEADSTSRQCGEGHVGNRYPHDRFPQLYYECTKTMVWFWPVYSLASKKCSTGDWFNNQCQACVKAGENPCDEPEVPVIESSEEEDIIPDPTEAPVVESSEEAPVVESSEEEIIPDPTEAPVVESSEEEIAPTEAPVVESSEEEIVPSEEDVVTDGPAESGSDETTDAPTDAPVEPSSSEEDVTTEAPVESSSSEEEEITEAPVPSSEEAEPDCPAVVCEENGQYIANPADCHSFYHCSWGTPYLQLCAMENQSTRLVFNPEINVCVWSWDYPCNVKC